MTRPLQRILAVLILATLGSAQQATAFPEPSPYPISWELDFEHGEPQRIVVDTGEGAPKAYWYLPYTVINNTGEERTFLPKFDMLTKDGRVIRSDQGVPYQVFQAIKKRQGNDFLDHFTQVGGEIRLGEDEAKDGVAIWQEPDPEMGRFSFFVSGLSGEATTLTDAQGQHVLNQEGKPTILRKTLQLNYHVRGDEVYPGEDPLDVVPQQWVMR